MDGIPWLYDPGERERAVLDAADFARMWKAEGWSVPDERMLRTLPNVTSGPQRGKWHQKAIAVEAFRDLLPEGPAGPTADLGAGIGWLSNLLRSWGHAPFAVDPCVDPSVGLGRARTFARHGADIPLAAGTLEHLPFRDGALGATVCNASLHYVGDVDPVLDEIIRVLRPRGVAYFLNSPVHDDRVSAARAQADRRAQLRSRGARRAWVSRYTHFVRHDLERSLAGRFVSIRRIDPDYGFAFTASRRLKSVLLRMELASFPLYAAEKAPRSSADPGGGTRLRTGQIGRNGGTSGPSS